jgi:predicted nuclease with TOPRIM domain
MDFLQNATGLNGQRLSERRTILKELITDKQTEVKRLQSEIGELKEQQARLTEIAKRLTKVAKQKRPARGSPETK